MLQPGQREMLGAAPGSELQDNRPPGQSGLVGEEDAAVGAATQLGEQFESRRVAPRARGIVEREGPAPRARWQSRRTSTCARHWGKRPRQLRSRRRLRELRPEDQLLGDYLESRFRLVPQVRLAVEILLRERTLTRSASVRPGPRPGRPPRTDRSRRSARSSGNLRQWLVGGQWNLLE